MKLTYETLSKIEIGTILHKEKGSDILKYQETVILYNEEILNSTSYKNKKANEFSRLHRSSGINLCIDDTFYDEDILDKECYYIYLEKNLNLFNNVKMKELERNNYETEDIREFVDVLSDLLTEDLCLRLKINNDLNYKIISLDTEVLKTVKLVEKEWPKEEENYNYKARCILSDFLINLMETLDPNFDENCGVSIEKEVTDYGYKKALDKPDETKETHYKIPKNKQTPLGIINSVKRKIVSQDEVIQKLIPVILSNTRLVNYGDKDLLKTEKNNILLIGPTGVGKTAIVNEVAEHLNLPMVKTAATNYSGVGYVDASLSETLHALMTKAKGNQEYAEKGIIFFDEIDKLFNSNLKIRDGIVDELLTWLSGTTITVKEQGLTYDFDTSLLTFIFGGAFSDIYLNINKNSIGFNREENLVKKKVNTLDLIKYGMKDEFAGRINLILELNPLKDFKSLKDILVYSEISPIKNLKKYFKVFHNIEITYDEELLDEITRRALISKTGARGLTIETSKLKAKLLEAVTYGYIEENSTIYLTPQILDDEFSFEDNNTKKLIL